MRLIDADALVNNINERIENMTSVGVAIDAAYLWALIYEEINEAPTIEPNKSADQNVADVPSDFISRDDAIDVVCKELQFQEENRNEPYDNGTCFGLKTARELLLALPSADRPSGEWLYEESGWYGGDGYRCSVCKYGYSATAYHEPYEWHYCPNCGAEMKGGAE